MELSDFQRRLLGFPQQAFGMSGNDADLDRARNNNLGQIGLALMAASGRMPAGSRMAALAQGMSQIQDPQSLAMNYAQQRLMQSAMQAKMGEVERQAALRQKLSDPAFVQGLGVNPQMAEVLGPDGVAELLTKRAGMNPLDDELKRAQINAYNNRPVALSPYEEAKQKQQAEFEMRTQEADQIGLQGDDRKEFLATGKITAGSGKAPTQDQANSATFYGMMETAEKDLSNPTIGPAATSRWDRALDAVPGGFGRGFTSPEYQLAENAQRNFVAAYLRKTSGNNITDGEFAMHKPLFFPQPGETDPRVLAQKAQNRKDAMAGILGSSPLEFQRKVEQRKAAEQDRGQPPVAGASAAGAPASASTPNAPQPGDVVKGYRFKGGNPADRNSWEPAR